MNIDDILIAGVVSLARKNKWPFKTALYYVTLIAALTNPAVVTVPNALRPTARQWNVFISHCFKERGVKWRLKRILNAK